MEYKVIKVLFVCLGNICRSPTAHAVFRAKAKALNLPVEVESAGTSAYHVGSKPDVRSVKQGKKRNYDFAKIKSRKLLDDDFAYYDFILAMDNSNLDNILARCPEEHKHKVALFLNFAIAFKDEQEVPDPYYGGAAGFEYVLDLIEDASEGLIQKLVKDYSLSPL